MVVVGIGPPKVEEAAKPTSSVRITRIFGAPFGAETPFGKSGVESLEVRPIFPLKDCSGLGKTSWAVAEKVLDISNKMLRVLRIK
jgi:hypothetical protein